MLETIKDFFMDRQFKEKLDFFRGIPLFSNLSYGEMGRLMSLMHRKLYPSGEVIFREGDIGKAVFIIQRGEIEIAKETIGGKDQVLTLLGPGDSFGDMALLDEHSRSARARATAESDLYILYKTTLDALMSRRPALGLKLISNLARVLSLRLRNTTDKIAYTG